MELKLAELMNSINSRFSGPESCKIQDMISGKLDFDDAAVKNYLQRLIDFGGMHGSYNSRGDRSDAERYLNLFTDFIANRRKSKV